MAKQKRRPPTDAELAILNVLWRLGPSTVRAVHDGLAEAGEGAGAYTTTLKLMQIMHDKGLLLRDTSQRSHVYQSTEAAAQTQRGLLTRLIDRAFGGSARELMVAALAARPTSKEDIQAIRTMLDELDEHGQPVDATVPRPTDRIRRPRGKAKSDA